MPNDRRDLQLTTTDGLRLEAEVALPASATAAVVLAHPHPAQGGSMRSLVTSELFRSAPDAGLAALRFNFRGVEGSEGDHAGGADEHHDIEAAIAVLADLTPGLPLVLSGWSFGADVALTVVDPRLAAWFLVAPPLRVVPLDSMAAAHDPRPKLLAVGEHDPFRPPASAAEVTEGWADTAVVTVAGADHFFAGRTARLSELLTELAARLVGEQAARS
jgi:alpha/beta superfamily hydrolase